MAKDINSIAQELLLRSQNDLCSHIHSLVFGINQLQFVPVETGSAYTDGKSFFYNPEYICREFYKNKNFVNRLILHSLLHCVLLHPFNTDFKDRDLWDIACDICVESIINKWSLSLTAMQDTAIQNSITEDFLKAEKNLTAENIYYLLLHMEDNAVIHHAQCFVQDKHSVWYDRANGAFGEKADDIQLVEARSIYKRADETGGGSIATDEKTLTQNVNSSAREDEDAWRKVASHVAMENESARSLGYAPGIDVQLIKAVSQRRYDYGAFLRSFLRINETVEINDDEFDYIFYTYGLKLYDNIPIIEPLEYVENNKIKKLFIAIDTSGSVKGDTVQGFMEKTYSILKASDYFSDKCEIHIIQCDSEIQDVSVVRNEQELEGYINSVSLRGFGGTDFRPVFEYVSGICENSKANQINGLIYFTDGDGVYPHSMPTYKSVFVVHDNGFDKSKIPSWCTVMYIDKLDLIR